jgi:excisionase family DNA binding protein
MSALVRALLADLDHEDLRELADRLAPFLPTPSVPEPDRWLNTREAAAYLGISVNALHRLTAARSIPFEQHAPGARCYFRRVDLDAWRTCQPTNGERR